jgi:hypothetical protein
MHPLSQTTKFPRQKNEPASRTILHHDVSSSLGAESEREIEAGVLFLCAYLRAVAFEQSKAVHKQSCTGRRAREAAHPRKMALPLAGISISRAPCVCSAGRK